MVNPLGLFLVFYGFHLAFYAAALDLFTTYLPEKMIYSGIIAGLVLWGLISFQKFLTALSYVLFFLITGKVGHRLKLWAMGDAWYLASTSALLAPALPNFFPYFFLFASFCLGVWAALVLLYISFKGGFLKWTLAGMAAAVPLAKISTALAPLPLMVVMLKFFRQIDEAGWITKKVNELEEEDLPAEDIDLGFTLLKKMEPLSRYDAFLARKSGKKKIIRIKRGYPLTPAFAIAYVFTLVHFYLF